MLMIFNLLIGNDVVSVLEGAEASNIYFVQQFLEGALSRDNSIIRLPLKMLMINYKEVGFNLFLLRLPHALILILIFFGFFWWGKKLFGEATVLLTLLVISSNFLVITVSKFVANDVWLLAFELMSFTSLILLLKQPIWKWRILFWLFTILAVCVNPDSALLFSFGMGIFLVFAHPKGKNLLTFYEIAFALLTILLVYFLNGFSWLESGFFFNYNQITIWDYLVANLLGVLPWLAFLPAAIFELFQKLRKREEMAIISIAFLLFSFLSYGLVLQFAFAFLIAKQIENFFKPNYPHSNLVKSFAVLNLLFSFFLVATFLLTGYDTFAEIGFRSRMGVAGVYWAFGFLAVIGLFGNDRKMIVGGMALSGMLAMLLFWTQISPLLENYRNLPVKLANSIEEITSEQKTSVFISKSLIDNRLSTRNEIYFKTKNINYSQLSEADSIQNKTGVFVLDEATYNGLDSIFVKNVDKIEVSGRNNIFEAEQKLWILTR